MFTLGEMQYGADTMAEFRFGWGGVAKRMGGAKKARSSASRIGYGRTMGDHMMSSAYSQRAKKLGSMGAISQGRSVKSSAKRMGSYADGLTSVSMRRKAGLTR